MKGFAVHPKLDCPHLSQALINELSQFLLNTNNKHFSQFQCYKCQDKSENWICLECKTIACSRYVKGHMAQHYDQKKHNITLSFSDCSFWCYACDSYIDHPTLVKARKQFSKSKFAQSLQSKAVVKEEKQEQEQEQDEQKLMEEEFKKLEVEQKIKKEKEEQEKEKEKLKYEEIIEGIKNKKYKKIVFLTGAGLSVAAGIPDFRTPGTGLYSQLQKFNLPRPQSIFEITYFAGNPQPFLKLSKQWGAGNFQPTDGHKFIRKIETEGLLHYCLTQNIDDLQSKAGISHNKLMQAHGHSRSAHCIKCKTQADIEQWKKLCEKQQCMKCQQQGCNGLVKPDIVFFGQQLPPIFFKAPELVAESDLVFIIGTSLAVFPFAFLAHRIKQEIPVILINNADSLPQRKDKVWMNGDIQENIRKICKDVDWKL